MPKKPKPYNCCDIRSVQVHQHDQFSRFYYDLVPVCHDCYRIYLEKDRRRMMSRLAPKATPSDDGVQEPDETGEWGFNINGT